MRYRLKINGERRQVEAEAGTPLLWVLRDNLGLTGTKFSCGVAQCGSCTVHVGDTPVRSCVLPVWPLRSRRAGRNFRFRSAATASRGRS